jgi:hypothetical protein
MKTTAKVKVRLVVEVDVGGAWGADCSLGQARSQGAEEARGKVAHMIQEHGRGGVRIVDMAALEMTVTDEF